MKVKINALNKDYLVEFKTEQEFIDFSTQHNDKIKNIEIINEDTLPQLEKPVELAKPSKSDGWKALEKSAFTTKEKGVNKKSMDLGGSYKEFKYEPDKTLSSQCDDKVSDPKIDSPALKGEEPKVKDVEATAKENEVEVKDAPKAETSSEEKAEPAKEEPKSEPAEKKGEDKAEKPAEDKEDNKDTKEEDEKKKEVEESYDAELNEVFASAGVELEEGIKDYLPRTGFIRTDDENKDSKKVGAFLGQGTDDQLKKAKIIAKVKYMNGDRFGRVSKEDLEHFDEYKAQYDEYFGNDEVDESAETLQENDEYSRQFGDKTLNDVLDDFINGKYSLKDIRKYMEWNELNPNDVDIQRLIKAKEEKTGIEIPLKEDAENPENPQEQDTITWLIDSRGMVEIPAPTRLVKNVAQSGDNAAAVAELKQAVADKLAKYDDNRFKIVLRETGAFENIDEMSREELEDYALWILAWDADERGVTHPNMNEEASKEQFTSPLADTDKEVEADAENKPSEEFKAELEKHGKLKGDGTDKLEEVSDEPNGDEQIPSGPVKVKAYDIQWDCDDADPEECGLPNEIELEINHLDDCSLDDEISDELSDSTGYCHYGFKYEIIKGE